MRARIALAVVATVAGCYRPRDTPCQVHCEYQGDRVCPGGLQCEADSLCHRPGQSCPSSDAPVDVPVVDAHPCTWGPFGQEIPIPELVNAVSTNFYAPSLRGDSQEMLFVSYSVTSYDLYRVTRPNAFTAWTDRLKVAELDTDAYDETDPALTANGLDLFYLSNASGKAQAYEATRPSVSDQFTAAVAVPALSSFGVAGLDISADGLTLYFTLPADSQLYTITRSSPQASFGSFVPVATVGGGTSPSISSDQREVFYKTIGVEEQTRMATDQPFDGTTEAAIDSDGADPEISFDGTTLIFASPSGAAMQVRSCL